MKKYYDNREKSAHAVIRHMVYATQDLGVKVIECDRIDPESYRKSLLSDLGISDADFIYTFYNIPTGCKVLCCMTKEKEMMCPINEEQQLMCEAIFSATEDNILLDKRGDINFITYNPDTFWSYLIKHGLQETIFCGAKYKDATTGQFGHIY
jgi:hypothetical protein